jgi:type IV pilus assembly protein PilY1
MWSYGPNDARTTPAKQGKSFHYPNCTTNYMIDTGVRGPTATEGALISLNSCTGSGPPGSNPQCPAWCSQCGAQVTQASINNDIQTALLRTRPYRGTPIAASLDDLYYHFKNDLTDQFGSCRHRYALLLTDGEPDDDYRSFGCNCAKDDLGKPVEERCGGAPNDPNDMYCPYPTAEEAANDLVVGRSPDKAMIERLFVVGLAIDDDKIRARLNSIAKSGCTLGGTACKNGTPAVDEAFFANNVDSLVSGLGTILDGLIEPLSRSVPAFARGTGDNKQYQFATGFTVPRTSDAPWTGLIDRRRFICVSGNLEGQDLDPSKGDRFQDVLNGSDGDSRRLLTVAPSTAGSLEEVVSSAPTTGNCPVGGCFLTPVELDTIAPARFGLASNDDAGKGLITDWMYGRSPSARGPQTSGPARRMGDIYHSSPVIVGRPTGGADEAYTLFANKSAVAGRPIMMYVNSNDGILHGFSVENYPVPLSSVVYAPGHEIWGFIPPLLLDNLNQNRLAHQFTMDGTPVVKDVYFNRDPAAKATGNEYHTVLITGMRGGGNAYVALDVTDPINPKFLWQFSDPSMGKTYGEPGIAQATFKVSSSGTLVTKNGAVAILPGGVGELGDSGISTDCVNGRTSAMLSTTSSGGAARFRSYLDGSNNILHRTDVRCWKDIGRSLFFVDIETGKLIKAIHLSSGPKPVFPSPLVSAPAIFRNEIGAPATRAFITDADGVIWRIDMSAADQVASSPLSGWTARPFHDVFWDLAPEQGELSYEAPILSVDKDGRVVVIVGTGDTNNFVKPTVKNRVVSLTEIVVPTISGPEQFKASLNWEKRVKATDQTGLVDSELVSGKMALFNRELFFGTFIAVTGGNACDLGKGRIHAVDYINRSATDKNGSNPDTPGPLLISNGADTLASGVINVSVANAATNFMVQGLALTERPSCTTATVPTDYWGAQIPSDQNANPAIWLVGHAAGEQKTGGLVEQRGAKSTQRTLGTMELQVRKRNLISRVLSWATSVD